MGVGAYALTSLAEAKAYLGTVPKRNGIWIYCSGATVASAEVTDTTLILINTATVATAHRAVTANVATIGTAAAHGLVAGNSVVIRGMADTAYNGTFTVVAAPDTTHFTFALTHAAETEIEDTGGTTAKATVLTLASSATITLLVTAILAVTNWQAGAICNGAASPGDLIVTGALACNTSANEITLKIEDNYNIEKLIDRATDLIERYCNRKLKSRSYNREFYFGHGQLRLILNQYPVTRVFRLSAGETNAFSVTCTTATTFASVEVTSTKIRLNKDGTVTDITIADDSTLTLLVDDINAETGWTATLLNSDYGAYKAFYTGVDGSTKVPEILIMPAAYCKSPNLAYVQIPDDDITDYRLDTVGADEDRDPGMLYMPGGFVNGEYYWLDYIAGYTTIPAALEEACLLLVKYKWNMLKKDSGVKSETLGDYSYTLADLKNALPLDVWNELQGFRKYIL